MTTPDISREKIYIPKIVVHLGLHKTGTTTIQRGLKKILPQLNAEGVGVLLHDDTTHLSSELGWSARRKAKKAMAGAFENDLRRLAYNQLGSVMAHTGQNMKQLLISNERITGARMPIKLDHPVFRPRTEKALAQILKPFKTDELELVVYLRRQDTYFESCYLWEIGKGHNHDITSQFPFMKEKPTFAYTAFLKRMKNFPGVSKLTVKPFEIVGAGGLSYLDDFLDCIGMKGHFDLKEQDVPTEVNTSISKRALEIAMKVNPMLDTQKQKKKMKLYLKANFPANEYGKAVVLSDEERLQILDLYRLDNERLFSEYMPHFPKDSYSSIEKTAELKSFLTTLAKKV